MKTAAPIILVSNDDGIHSDGLAALVEAVAPLGEVWVVAPEQEQSASSHALSLHRPLRMKEIKPRWFAVDGTPSDCVYLAVHHILKNSPPALMVSGINHGANLAEDVIYSGTVAAAMEACILGVPAIAFSLVGRRKFEFSHAARFVRSLSSEALERQLPPRFLLNVNIPLDIEPQGFAITRLGTHSYAGQVLEKEDPRGNKYYWIGGAGYQHQDLPGSDCNAVFKERRISVTPLHLDLSDDAGVEFLSQWHLDGGQKLS